jgi:hypothetical protein
MVGRSKGYFNQVSKWIESATRNAQGRSSGQDEKLNLIKMSSEDLIAVAVDLDGILDAVRGTDETLGAVLHHEPSAEHLEDALVEVESHLGHAMSHWADLVHRLRGRDLWPEPDEDDLDPFQYAGSHIAEI